MPSPEDQLSKLTGTAFICVCVGFLFPSIGVNSEADIFSNLVALSIFVITIVVNICIQMKTGVIVLFIPEHITILCFMLLLLLMFWTDYSSAKAYKSTTSDRYNDLFVKGNTSMFDRLKLCYVYASSADPQFASVVRPATVTVTTICLACSAVALQASFRSLILKQFEFCKGISDYDWSMLVIVINQILTVIVGTLAIAFRCLAMVLRIKFEFLIVNLLGDDTVRHMNQVLGRGTNLPGLLRYSLTLLTRTLSAVQAVIALPIALVHYLISLFIYQNDDLELFDLPQGLIMASSYRMRKSVNDILSLSLRLSESSHHLLNFLLDKTPSSRVLPLGIKSQDGFSRDLIPVSSLSIALLMKIAQVSMPHDFLKSLLNPFNEAKEIIFYIDTTLNPKSSKKSQMLSYAKALWIHGDFSRLLPNGFTGARTPAQHESNLDPNVARAVNIIAELRLILLASGMDQAAHIIDFIDPARYWSLQDLQNSIKQLFVDMLHALLLQLPTAIFKSLNFSPAEEFEKRALVAIKYIVVVGYLEERIDWMPKVITYEDPEPRELRNPLLARLAELRNPLLARLAEILPVVPNGRENQNREGEV